MPSKHKHRCLQFLLTTALYIKNFVSVHCSCLRLMQQTQVVVTPIERAYEVSHVKTENICDQSQRTGNDQPYYTFCLN